MDVRVSGHQIDIGTAFRTHATDRLQAIVAKHAARAVSANVTLQPGPHDAGFVCEIVMPLNGLVMKGSGRAQDAHIACDAAADKIEKQLRRYTRRLKDRHGAGPARQVDDRIDDNANYVVFRVEDDVEEAGDAPLVVAETRVDVPESSVSDAVMMLDLRNTTALLFKNSKTGVFNMVYRRDDGNVGWVEPSRT
jgi:ribosomal subunit interface protein